MNRIVAKILSNAGYSNVYDKDPPKSISNYILVSSSGGFGLGAEDAGFGRPTVQIIVANKNYETLSTNIKAIIETLINLDETDIRDLLAELYEWDDWTVWTQYDEWDTYINKDDREIYDYKTQGFDILSDALELGRDEDLRYLKSINFIVYYNYN